MPVKIADFIEAPNSGGNYEKVLLVVHLTISPEVRGAARGVVAFWNRGRTGSTQYVVDAHEIIQSVREAAYPWAAGTTANRWGIHVELCGFLQTLRQWRDDYSSAELELAAPLFAELGAKHGIPLRWLSIEEIREAVRSGDPRKGGMCTHADITKAFPGETTHTDPGSFFPKPHFLDLVQAAAEPEPGLEQKPTVDLPVATYNPGDGSDADKVADLDDIRKFADLIGGQEFGDRGAVIQEFLRSHPHWAVWRDTEVPGAAKLPVFYDTRVLQLDEDDSHAIPVFEGGYVGTEGAGPDEVAAKALVRTTFTHLPTGRRIHYINQHLAADHMDEKLPAEEQRLRSEIADLQAAAFVAEAGPRRGIVIGGGDWNGPKSWVEANVPGFTVDNDGPTFRRAQIDHIGHFDNPALSVKGHLVLETSGSRKIRDHRSAVVTYSITVREDAA